jgi:hypothetical protein
LVLDHSEFGSEVHEGTGFGANGIRIRMAEMGEEVEEEKPQEEGFFRHEIRIWYWWDSCLGPNTNYKRRGNDKIT